MCAIIEKRLNWNDYKKQTKKKNAAFSYKARQLHQVEADNSDEMDIKFICNTGYAT